MKRERPHVTRKVVTDIILGKKYPRANGNHSAES